MDSRTLFKTIVSILVVTGSLISCGGENAGSPGGTTAKAPSDSPVQNQTNPQTRATAHLELALSDMTVDSTGPFPVYKVSKSLSLAGKIQVHFNLDALNNPAITTREQLIVPFNNNEEMKSATWGVESPAKLNLASLKVVEISKDDINDSVAASMKFYSYTDSPTLTFKLRIVFSDTNLPERTSLAVIEVPFAR